MVLLTYARSMQVLVNNMFCKLLTYMTQFQVLDDPDKSGRFPIDVYQIDIDKIRENAEKSIAQEPKSSYHEYSCGIGWHTSDCAADRDMLGGSCAVEDAEEARQQKKKLNKLYLLKDCTRDPQKANWLRTLDGLAQESCIYDTEYAKPFRVEVY
jgi:hypothetical protein